MSILGRPGSEDRKKFYAVCVAIVLAAGYLYYQFGGSSTPSAPPPPAAIAPAPSQPAAAAGPSAKVVATTSARLDPTLDMRAMLVTESVVYSGTGRNIFSAISAPVVVIPKPIAAARLQPKLPPPPPPLPCPPNCPPPPPPPPIDLKFCGYFASSGTTTRKAILLHGDDVFLASPGDVLLRRYRIVSIAQNSIQVEDMPNNNTQTLPLIAN